MKNDLTNYQLKQIEEAKGLIEKFRRSKNFEQKKNEKIAEESWASDKNKFSDERKFCLVLSVEKSNKPRLGVVSLSQNDMTKGNYFSFEMPNEQLYSYGELVKIM